PTPTIVGPTERSGPADHQATGRHTGACGDQNVVHVVDLVHGAAAHLPHALGNTVHPVDIGLAELAAVRVQRQRPVELQRAVPDEVAGLTATAEPEFFELHQHVRCEVVIEHPNIHIGGPDTGL